MSTLSAADLEDPCCPITLGEVCWDDGLTDGRAFALFDPVTSVTSFIDQLTGSSVLAANIVACPPDDDLLTPLDSIDAKTPALATSINSVVTRTQVVAAGNTAAGLHSVTITNVGSTAGTVGGAPINPGQTISISGYFDEVTRQMVRLAAIAYTASATAILHITSQT